jgi:type VI protein secretion system component VasF
MFEREHAPHEPSKVDAMGLDKRRAVVGRSYGPSVRRQAALYGVALAITAILVAGFILLAHRLDQPPDTIQAKAPWAGTRQAPRPIQ